MSTDLLLYAAILLLALGFLTLGALALSNWRAVIRDREAMGSDATEKERYYADMEVRRALLRAIAWWTLSGALLPRLLIAERSFARSSLIMVIAALAIAIFVYEGLMGRRERHRMLRDGEWDE